MKNDQAWKNNSNGGFLQYDFSLPVHWTAGRLAAEWAAIEAPDSSATAQEPGWLHLARRLPDALRAALIVELQHGNQIASIGSTGWPSDGSVVVSLRDRFSTARKPTPPGVVWRELNDPHYCREELSQKVDGVEFLLIT
jgi:hypothetical protein